MTFEDLSNSLLGLQVSTDNIKKLTKRVKEMADKTGAINIMFYTERNPKAWEKLIGAKTIGNIMEV